MDEKELKLLVMALKAGKFILDQNYEVLEWCEYKSDDYFHMVQKLSEMIGVDLSYDYY